MSQHSNKNIKVGDQVQYVSERYPHFVFNGALGIVARVIDDGSAFCVRFDGCGSRFVVMADEISTARALSMSDSCTLDVAV